MTFRGEKVEIHVDSEGMFYARIGLDSLKEETLKALVAKLRRASNKTRVTVAVPATLLNVQDHTGSGFSRKYHGQTCKRVVLTGINPKTDEVNFTYENGEKGSQSRWNRDAAFGRPMTDADIAEWKRLDKARRVAKDAFDKFEEKFTGRLGRNEFDALQVVKDAIEAKAVKEHEVVDDDGDPR